MAHQSPSPRWGRPDDKPSPFPTCQFPRGDKETGWDFCGAEPVRGKPYCEEHCVQAYRQVQTWKLLVGKNGMIWGEMSNSAAGAYTIRTSDEDLEATAGRKRSA
jgi:hypothetical protein